MIHLRRSRSPSWPAIQYDATPAQGVDKSPATPATARDPSGATCTLATGPAATVGRETHRLAGKSAATATDVGTTGAEHALDEATTESFPWKMNPRIEILYCTVRTARRK